MGPEHRAAGPDGRAALPPVSPAGYLPAPLRPSHPPAHSPSHPPGAPGRPVGDSVYAPPSSVWAPVELDRPVDRFEPRPPSGSSYRPDTVFDGWSGEHVRVRLASVRGYAHRGNGRPREDDIAVALHGSGTLVFAVADGVSGAEQSHLGATLACRTAVDTVTRQLDEGCRPDELDWAKVLNHAAYQLVAQTAKILGLAREDAAAAERLMATTLVTGVLVPARLGLDVHLVSAGDSGAWLLSGGGHYMSVIPAEHDGAGPVASSAVVALPRVPAKVRVHTAAIFGSDRLLVGTDGFGGPLGDGTGPVGRLFAEHLAPSLEPRGLAHLLDFSRETFDDDRTLLVVWPASAVEARP
ncbi:protein phosphatase 2C-like protein [Streptomyces sp. 1114.5]|uniref:protein phosphatase 2C domain-containing protein n=1 Tax=unclassified Streptomyces TaxID=2593676 RepID=UPI000BD150C2|nr:MULTISPECIES: protein phosphatase 2C domain-containing protein [unclassified Streptomyces]RKT17550.1 protein phosphatase 2C-like protein [Streptomyces sp. 1114.5]SOB83759.1 Protein phosphatase 2C [Streptomyces sp. 1331.2]